jgi:hypothetical protein
MSIVDKDDKSAVLTFVLPPLLAQHALPAGIEYGKRAAARMEGSCGDETPRTLNSCFYRTVDR